MRKAGVRVYGSLPSILLTGVRTSPTRPTAIGVCASPWWPTWSIVSVNRSIKRLELLITALKRGWRVVERPTVWHERSSGQSKKGSNLLFGLRYGRVIAATWWRER